jgi:putative serine protease PepD
MTLPSRAGAIAAGLLLSVGAGAAVATAVHGHDSSALPATAAPASPNVRSASDTSNSDAKRVYNGASDAVAYISSTLAQGQATGSGFVVTTDGKIITNEHVVDGAQQVTVKLGTSGKEVPAKVLAADASKDLALLQIDTGGKKLHALPLGDSSKVSVGDSVYAIGNPFGLDHTLTSGIVSALGRDIQAPDGTPIQGAIQTDAAINPGNSGGALLDGDGNVIGVNSQIASAGQSEGTAGNVGIGFAIPSNTVKAFVEHPTSTGSTAQQEQGLSPDQQQVDPSQQQVDPNQQVDPSQGQQIDPSQIDPSQGQQIDPSQIDPSQIDPSQGQQIDPSQIDPSQGQSYGLDPSTGQLVPLG